MNHDTFFDCLPLSDDYFFTPLGSDTEDPQIVIVKCSDDYWVWENGKKDLTKLVREDKISS